MALPAWLNFWEQPVTLTIVVAIVLEVLVILQAAYKQIYEHPLSKYPGPKLAAITGYRKAWIEVVRQKSWHQELLDLHKKYGPIVRVGPNELHFNNPQAYHDIYNNSNRWDKEEQLYHSMGEDRSSFGFLTYKESKERKDVLNRFFSTAAMQTTTPLVQEKVDALCDALTKLAKTNTPADLSFAFRCLSADVITYLCYGKSVDAIQAPGFRAPLLVALDASLPGFVAFKHSSTYKNMIMGCPPALAKLLNPAIAGLVDLQQLIMTQIRTLTADPTKMQELAHNNTIFHTLLDPKAHKNGQVPEEGSLYEEAQALMFAGADTVGNALMQAMYYLMKRPEVLAKLKEELKTVWPDIKAGPPSTKTLAELPYFSACIKETLRHSHGVISGLPRVVPDGGAKIVGEQIPEDTIVSIGHTFVHYNAEIFEDPMAFKPERWLDNPELDHWLVAFSRGPRACPGINLAYVELRLTLAAVVRKFDFKLDPSSPPDLSFREAFLPIYRGSHVKAMVTPVTA